MRPRSDSDPVSPDDDPTGQARGGGSIARIFNVGYGIRSERCENVDWRRDLSGSAGRDCVEVVVGGG